MAKLIKFSLTGWQKAALGIVLVADVVRLLLELAATKSFGLFLTLGIVPGGDRSLSPNTVILLCIVVFITVFLLVFSSNLFRLFRRPTQPILGVKSLEYYLPPQRITHSRERFAQDTSLGRPRRRVGILAALRLTLLNGLSVVKDSVVQWWPVVVNRLQMTLKYIAYYSVKATKAVWRDTKRFWRFSEPYLKKADKLIESRLRKALGLPYGA